MLETSHLSQPLGRLKNNDLFELCPCEGIWKKCDESFSENGQLSGQKQGTCGRLLGGGGEVK